MSKTIRIIPRLDIKGPNLVKGIHMEGLRVLGKPEDFARYYYENGADELMYQDVVASLYNRNSLQDIITRTAKEIFIPLTVGGGIRNLDDINTALRAGADKVCLNTAAINNPEFIRQASRKYGSSTIVVAIEAIKQTDGRYLAYTVNGREHTGKDVFDWAKQVDELGAGEIVITSVDREGTGEGYDIELTRKISELVSIPIIAHGGPGKLEHISAVIKETGCDAVAIASMLHYDYITKYRATGEHSTEGNFEFLKKGANMQRLESHDLHEIKKHLHEFGIPCRVEELINEQ